MEDSVGSILSSVLSEGVKYVRYSNNDKEDDLFAKKKEDNSFLEALKPKPSKGLMDYKSNADDPMQEKLKKADAVGLDFWKMFNKKDNGPDYTEMWSNTLAR